MPITKLKNNLRIFGTSFVEDYTFDCGNTVPVYDVWNMTSLNQIIGHAKYNNKDYGNVYYRGECKLHKGLQPSLLRNIGTIHKADSKMKELVNAVADDKELANELKVVKLQFEHEINEKHKKDEHPDFDKDFKYNHRHRIEGVLQHYGIPTRFIDLVDNHWVALWMGLYHAEHYKNMEDYIHYERREIPYADFLSGVNLVQEELYQYIILMALPYGKDNSNGIIENDDFVEVDLRQALPSTFLRPHAQHGYVVRKKLHSPDQEYGYDMATEVIGILRMRIDRVQEWIGNGKLLTQENLFPSLAFDRGYQLLLNKNDLFKQHHFEIARFV